jgi:hypothetical protein
MGGYFLITCYDYDGEWSLHPHNFKNLVMYWSQLEKKEYDILLTMKSKNGLYLTSGFDIERKYENFVKNAAAVHYWDMDDFYHLLDFLVDYTPRMISRHLQNPQFPLADLWKSG